MAQSTTHNSPSAPAEVDTLGARPYSPDTLAMRWDCDPSSVKRLCRSGKLKHFTVGKGLYRITPEVVAAYERGDPAGALAAAAPTDSADARAASPAGRHQRRRAKALDGFIPSSAAAALRR